MSRFAVAIFFVLTALSTGYSQAVSSLIAPGLQATDKLKDARTLNNEAYDLILKDDYAAAIV